MSRSGLSSSQHFPANSRPQAHVLLQCSLALGQEREWGWPTLKQLSVCKITWDTPAGSQSIWGMTYPSVLRTKHVDQWQTRNYCQYKCLEDPSDRGSPGARCTDFLCVERMKRQEREVSLAHAAIFAISQSQCLAASERTGLPGAWAPASQAWWDWPAAWVSAVSLSSWEGEYWCFC